MTGAAEVTAAAYFSLVRAAWVPCVVTWDPDSGEFRRIEGLWRFESYREALQASGPCRLPGSPAYRRTLTPRVAPVDANTVTHSQEGWPMWSLATVRFVTRALLSVGLALMPPAIAIGQGEIYATNENDYPISVYPRTANGEIRPLWVIGGEGGVNADAIVADEVNNEIIVAKCDGGIFVYDRQASGAASPRRTIRGSATGLGCFGATALALDVVHNEIFVCSGGNGILVFSRTANGNVAPLRRIAGPATGACGLSPGLAVDPVNDEVFLSDVLAIRVFRRAASGNALPIRQFGVLEATSIALDVVSEEIIVGIGVGLVQVYSRTATGSASSLRAIYVGRPVRSVSLDRVHGELFVYHEGGISVYSRTDSDDAPHTPPATPLRTIPTGSATQLAGGPSIAVTTTSSPSPKLVGAVLPASRSVQVNSAATAFATVINAGNATATGVGISLATSLPANLSYQTTNPNTNQPTGTPNTATDILPGQTQTYVFSITPTSAFGPTNVALNFAGTNAAPADALTGINTLLLSASTAPVPDIVALAATPNNDGIVNIPGTTGTGILAVATVNVGTGASITASADTGSVTIPVKVLLCQTNPAMGVCTSPISPTVTTQINAGETPTFGIFVTGTSTVLLDPATNRIFVRFKDLNGVTRGATSVAVRTQ